MKILHIITGLKDGGAENILYKICQHDKLNNHIVISITSGGKYFLLLKKLGVKVYCMNMKFYSMLKFFYLIKFISNLKPDLVQTWLVHGDFLGGIAAKLAGVKNLVWTILYSKLDKSIEKKRNIFLIRILAKLSYLIPDIIIVVSKSSKKNCQNLGYQNKKIKLVTTGFDLSLFKVKKYQKLNFKKKVKIKSQIPLIGIVARYNPVKDHSNLLNALRIINSKKRKFFCVFVGSEMNNKNKILREKIKKFNLNKYVKLLGPKNNIPEVMNGLDVNILCSKSEGFPSVLVEAMACGTPCVVTDVGDSAAIVGKTGWIVPPNNSVKLGKAIDNALSEIGKKAWSKRCSMARKRAVNYYGLKKMINSYRAIWSNF